MIINSKTTKIAFLFLIFSLGFILFNDPWRISAADCVRGVDEYCLLEPLPLTNENAVVEKTNIGTYVPQVLRLAIALAGALAVIMLIWAGFQYIASDGFGKKSNAREKINSALVGLLLVIGSYSILYTINPAALTLNLTIDPVPAGKALDTKIPNTTTLPGPSAPPDGTVPPAGTECPGCVYVSSADFPQKPPGSGCTTALPQKKCQVVAGFVGKFKTMNIYMKAKSVGWRVTEMYPPTVKHEESCHYNGRCVDAALTSAATPANIKIFLDEIILNVSSNFIYEVPTATRLKQLQDDPILAGLRSYFKLTGAPEHAHIRYE